MAGSSSGTRPIPKPPGHPVIGNLLDLKGETPLLNLVELARVYGPIFRLELGGRSVVVLSSLELVHAVCDSDRFDKFLGPGLLQARTLAGDGLFTAWTHEHWAWVADVAFGIVVALWIVIQYLIIQRFHPLQAAILTIGVIIAGLALLPGMRRYYAR